MRPFFYLFFSVALILILFTSAASSMQKNGYLECGAGILHGHPPTPFTPSGSPTDLAIDGNGFFPVRSQPGDNLLFTRFGNFHFDAQGYLVSSHGHIVQGWPMDESGIISGSIGDIQISFLPDTANALNDGIRKSSITIDENGIISGRNASGTLLALYTIGLARFYDPHMLALESPQLFSATQGSGNPVTNKPGEIGLGALVPYSLEGSTPIYETGLSVDGDGFFVVDDPTSDARYYTDTNAFRLNVDYRLVSSDGHGVQGWALDENGGITGSIGNIQFTPASPPGETDHITVSTNLDSGAKGFGATDTALSGQWQNSGTLTPDQYEYKETVTVWDMSGVSHSITLYYDPALTDSTYEFIVTCTPSEDKRTDGFLTENNRGLLARGTITFFEASGNISDIDMSILDAATGVWTELSEETDLKNNYFWFWADFFGFGDTMQQIELNMGANSSGLTDTWINEPLSTTWSANPSATTHLWANGHAAGDILQVWTDENGVVHALYDNGLEPGSFRIALALFENPQGLETVAPNLYRETVAGGDAAITPAGESGSGTIDFADKCPVPDIKANTLDGPITLSHDSSLSITIDLDPGILEGQNADWWIGVNTPWAAPADWYTLVHNGVTVNWEQGAALSFQGNLQKIVPFPVFTVNNSLLSPGQFTFFFAIDNDADGSIDAKWQDSVEVNILP